LFLTIVFKGNSSGLLYVKLSAVIPYHVYIPKNICGFLCVLVCGVITCCSSW